MLYISNKFVKPYYPQIKKPRQMRGFFINIKLISRFYYNKKLLAWIIRA